MHLPDPDPPAPDPAAAGLRTWIRRQRQQLPFWGLTAGAAIAGAALQVSGTDQARRFLGPVPPLAAVGVGAALGSALLPVLARRGWCPPVDRLDRAAASRMALGATVLAGAAVTFDVFVPFGRDINIAWPASLAFYPLIAQVAEVGLHLLPLAAVALVGERLPGRRRAADGARIPLRPALGILASVAAIEAIGQAAAAATGPEPLAALFVAPHLLVIGLVELLGFRRYGFGALVAFRLTYYLLWHILWGAARLHLLF